MGNTFMKNKTIVVLLLFLALLMGCKKDDNSTSPQFTIESEINAARPYHFVFIINPSTGSWNFEKNGVSPNNPFSDAYAEDGFLIVVTNVGKMYFNLNLAKDIEIEPDANSGRITLRY
jgi:hypothetical protein